MELKIEVPEKKLQHFSTGARNKLEEQAKIYTFDLIKEAERLEGVVRESKASSEVTGSIIVKAANQSRSVRRKPWWMKGIRTIADIGFVILGWFISNNDFLVGTDGQVNFTNFVIFLCIFAALVGAIIVYDYMGGE